MSIDNIIEGIWDSAVLAKTKSLLNEIEEFAPPMSKLKIQRTRAKLTNPDNEKRFINEMSVHLEEELAILLREED